MQLQNASIGGSTYTWSFGDGSDTITRNQDPVYHSFINASFVNNASYQVTLLQKMEQDVLIQSPKLWKYILP